ncbi:XrtA/PEP-CTERM system TPR-repeat protein PrsT [Thalassotalea castellviae]|uniref:PEP-CTERM system TPR-repeat protein PrsT n=1 Tax=Thalassotalea castellviae TaxID=3075612 RepID=A0ABU3A7R9_9GAMM|nr:XrtA/PEP-CTERM system TPR-repeat protein PrsT [Thalassotalea sp. W431]MDT0605026.1 PEP-CTERM system TPR-repeat protein PrsT [Thalassotalea sp. W431]
MKHLIYIIIVGLLFSCSKQSSEDHMVAAKKSIASEDYKAAVIELKNAVKASPTLAEARFLLGKMHLKNLDYQSAEKELNKALELNYPVNEVLPLLSQAYQKTRSDVALIGLSHQENGLTPEEQAEIAFYKIQAMFRLDQSEKAQALIDEVQKTDTDSVFKTLALVYSLLIDEKIDAAKMQLETIIENEPKQADALKLLALIALKNGEQSLAADTYGSYLTYYPNDLEIAFINARLLVELNRTKEAEPIIDKLLAINEDNGLLNQLKGIARFNEKDNEKALFHTEKAISKMPSDPALRLLAAYSAYRLKNYEITHQHLSIIAEELPPNHEALRLLAVSQLHLGFTKEAGETVNSLEELSEKDNSLVSSVGLALVNSGEVKQARNILSKSTELGAETAEDLTRLGLLKLSLNDVEGITNLETALDKKPDQEITRNTLATAYLTTQQFDKAMTLAKRWKSADKQDEQAYLLAASVYFKQEKFDLAKAEYQQILSFNPKHAGARLALVDLAAREKDFSTAKRELDTVLASEPSNVSALVKLYQYESDQGDSSKAVNIIEQQNREFPENKAVQLLLAKVYLQENMAEKTVDLLRDFDEKNAPKIYWQTLGQAYFKLKDFKKVQNHYQAWLEKAPSDRDAILSNLLLLDNQRKYEQALSLSTQYVENFPNDTEIALLNIHFLLISGDFTSANAQLALIPEPAKALPFTKGLLGQLQLNQKQYSQALENLNAAYKAQPTPRNVNLVYFCLVNSGQKEQGYNFLQQHVENNTNDVASLMHLAQLQIAKDTAAAIKSYERVLSITDDNFIALNNLAYFYLEANQLDKAQQHAEKALALKSNMADVLDTVGRIHLAKKEYEPAVKYLTKAVSENGDNEEIYLNYVEALLLSNNKVLAQRKINQKTFKEPNSMKRVAELKKNYQLD